MRSDRIGVMAGQVSPPRPDRADPGGLSSGPRARLVIADDDPVVQAMLDMSLGREFEVVGLAADSEQAVELARASQPDAALVDVRMPKGGGLLAVKGIREVAPDTAIVILSGHRSHGIVRELMRAGAIAYRRKGVAPHVLAAALTESIRVHAVDRRASAWPILAPYCRSLDRRPRAH
jgi:DNA-binding NarL/FixJ family response regulator